MSFTDFGKDCILITQPKDSLEELIKFLTAFRDLKKKLNLLPSRNEVLGKTNKNKKRIFFLAD